MSKITVKEVGGYEPGMLVAPAKKGVPLVPLPIPCAGAPCSHAVGIIFTPFFLAQTRTGLSFEEP